MPNLILLSGWSVFFIVLCVIIAFFILVKSIPMSDETKRKYERYKQGLLADDDDLGMVDTTTKVNEHPSTFRLSSAKYGDYDFFVNSAFPNRKRILDESIAIVKNTKKIDILISRYNTIIEVSQWIREAQREGFPVSLSSTNNNFDDDLNWLINENIVRIARSYYETYLSEIYKLKTSKAIDNRTVSIFPTLEKCKGFLKSHPTKSTYENIIDNLHFLVEENFSSRSLSLPPSKKNNYRYSLLASCTAKIKKLRKTIKPPFSLKYNVKARIISINQHIDIIRNTLDLSEIKTSFKIILQHYKVLASLNAQILIDFFDDDDFVNNFYQMINDNLVRISIEYCSEMHRDDETQCFVQECIDFVKKAPNIGNTLSKLETLIGSESYQTISI